MKSKYREAMRAAARRPEPPDEDDDADAAEAMGWHDEWVMWGHEQQNESSSTQGSQE